MLEADGVGAAAALADALALAAEDDDEVHAEDADGGVVLDTQIDVLGDTEAEGAVVGEVVLAQLELLDLQTLLQDLQGLVAADGDGGGDLLVTADTEGADGQAGTGEDGGLAGQLLQHTAGKRQTITSLADRNVEDQLLNEDVLHGVHLDLMQETRKTSSLEAMVTEGTTGVERPGGEEGSLRGASSQLSAARPHGLFLIIECVCVYRCVIPQLCG